MKNHNQKAKATTDKSYFVEVSKHGRKFIVSKDGIITSCEYVDGRGITRKARPVTQHINTHGYCMFSCSFGGSNHTCSVHRLIAKAFLSDYSDDLFTDHINGLKHDNRACNLRMATGEQNQQSYRKPSTWATSKYRGVSFNSASEKWVAQIKVDGKARYLGVFESEISAALAYNKAATEYGFDKMSLNVMGAE